MKQKNNIVLVGGGHTHALFLKRLQQRFLRDAQITLLSASRYTAYSGMLPGVISGHYSPESAHIDLQRLALESGCDFKEGVVCQLDPDTQRVTLATDERIDYDLLSINTGSTQSGFIAGPQCLSIKPVQPFLHWLYRDLPEQLKGRTSPFELVIVGAGAAGVETALALKHRYQQQSVNIHLVSSGKVLAGHSPAVQKMGLAELVEKSIKVHPDFKVSTFDKHRILSERGESLYCDQLILATSASAHPWPSEAGLATDERGFIVVNDSLQSISHSNVFAAGDVASIHGVDVPRSGVIAVRQAPVLFHNIASTLLAKPLKPFRTRQHSLALLSCADGKAMASRGWFRAKGRAVWHWKDLIDRQFMKQFPAPESNVFF